MCSGVRPGEDVARLTGYGLQALQHRGQESAGIAVGDGAHLSCYKNVGLVTQVFDDAVMDALVGDLAVGHVRYSTSGAAASRDAAQPHLSSIDEVEIALVHNGTLLNTEVLRASLEEEGATFASGTDTEVATRIIAEATRRTGSVREGIRHAMEVLEGAYAMILATPEALYAFRDPHGIRPCASGACPGRLGGVVGNLRPRYRRRRLRARCGTGRGGAPRARRPRCRERSCRAAPRFLHFRVRVLRPPRQRH